MELDYARVAVTHVVKEELIVARHGGVWEILESEKGRR